jgi:hypothetical protein
MAAMAELAVKLAARITANVVRIVEAFRFGAVLWAATKVQIVPVLIIS